MNHFTSDVFSARVQELMQQHHVPGLSVAVVQGDECAAKGFGLADVETSEPVTEDTLFDVASSSKSLTAAAVGLLVADNDKYPEVQYDVTMSSLLPDDFVMSDVRYTEGVTIDDVLGHRTGMPGHDLSYMSPRAAQPDTPRTVTRNLRNLAVAAPLRSRYIYCNMMYTAATHLVEVKSQQTFSTFLHERFFDPLGMSSTSLQPALAREKGHAERLATGYHWDKGSYLPIPIPDCPEAQGAGSIITSATDFIKWVKALLRLEHPISEKVYQGLIRLRSFPNPGMRRLKPFTSPTFYAAGLEVYYYRGHMVVGHDGCISGFGSRFFFLPGSGFGAAIMGNSGGTGAVANAVVRDLLDVVLGVPEEERATAKKQPGKPKNSKPKKAPSTNGKPKMPIRPKNESEGAAQEGTKDGKQEDRPKKEAKQASVTPKASAKPGGDQKSKGKEKAPPPPQETPLDAYVGTYWHPGYHEMTVEVKDDKLFIDATDRSFGFTITFEHVSDQKIYTAHSSDMWEGGDQADKAEFVFEDGRAVKMGLDLEDGIKELIWFERQVAKDP
ncbi:beta-lactamase family protein [Whalleya microplaca]|nr:beta-lactamase family protein [Whalleya microplaca]